MTLVARRSNMKRFSVILSLILVHAARNQNSNKVVVHGFIPTHPVQVTGVIPRRNYFYQCPGYCKLLHISSAMASSRFPENDPYQILNLERNSGLTKQAIKDAYRRMASMYHPDIIINRDSTPEEKSQANDYFARINSAYQALLQQTSSDARHEATSSSSVPSRAGWVSKGGRYVRTHTGSNDWNQDTSFGTPRNEAQYQRTNSKDTGNKSQSTTSKNRTTVVPPNRGGSDFGNFWKSNGNRRHDTEDDTWIKESFERKTPYDIEEEVKRAEYHASRKNTKNQQKRKTGKKPTNVVPPNSVGIDFDKFWKGNGSRRRDTEHDTWIKESFERKTPYDIAEEMKRAKYHTSRKNAGNQQQSPTSQKPTNVVPPNSVGIDFDKFWSSNRNGRGHKGTVFWVKPSSHRKTSGNAVEDMNRAEHRTRRKQAGNQQQSPTSQKPTNVVPPNKAGIDFDNFWKGNRRRHTENIFWVKPSFQSNTPGNQTQQKSTTSHRRTNTVPPNSVGIDFDDFWKSNVNRRRRTEKISWVKQSFQRKTAGNVVEEMDREEFRVNQLSTESKHIDKYLNLAKTEGLYEKATQMQAQKDIVESNLYMARQRLERLQKQFWELTYEGKI